MELSEQTGMGSCFHAIKFARLQHPVTESGICCALFSVYSKTSCISMHILFYYRLRSVFRVQFSAGKSPVYKSVKERVCALRQEREKLFKTDNFTKLCGIFEIRM